MRMRQAIAKKANENEIEERQKKVLCIICFRGKFLSDVLVWSREYCVLSYSDEDHLSALSVYVFVCIRSIRKISFNSFKSPK